jgi:hypothetical protein
MILSTDSELRTCGETATFHRGTAAWAWFSDTFGSMTKLPTQLIDCQFLMSSGAFGLHFGQTDKLYKRTLGRADVSTAPTFKTVKNAELLSIFGPIGLDIDADFLRLKTHRAGIETPAAADTIGQRLGVDLIFTQKEDR